MKTLAITYCSKEKLETKQDLPAIERYASERIKRVFKASLFLGFNFCILSGEYGLLAPEAPIPYYDHLLIESELEGYIPKITIQLKEKKVKEGIKEVLLFTEGLKRDANLIPYHQAIETACKTLGIKLQVIELGLNINENL